MSAEKLKASGPAAHPVRMDQEFQLQNLARLATDPTFDSMGQYAGTYSIPGDRDHQDFASYTQAGSRKNSEGNSSGANMDTNMGVQIYHAPPELPQAPALATQTQILDEAPSPAGSQSHVNLVQRLRKTPNVSAFDYDTWKMTTSPPRLFMTPLELSGSTVDASDDSSVSTRVSSGAFSLISGDDERLTATDNPVRIPRSVVNWSDPNPGGAHHPSHYVDESPTPASRVRLFERGPSLLSRLNFVDAHAYDDPRSNKSLSGDLAVTGVHSQILPTCKPSTSGGLYSKPSFTPNTDGETIKPHLHHVHDLAVHGIVTSENYTPTSTGQGSIDTRHQPRAPQGLARIGNNAARSGADTNNVALASTNCHTGLMLPDIRGHQPPQNMAVSKSAVLGSPIAMTGSSQVPFRPSTALSTQITANFSTPVAAIGGRSQQLTRLLSNYGGAPVTTKMLDAEYFPFVETARDGCGPVNHGVIKITNVPFEVGRNEVFAFLGRNSRVLHDNLEPIHIVMCRVTGKTLDIFVELQTPADASRAVDRHLDNCAAGRPSKLGDRQVDVHLSDQAGLMKVLFPKAHAVQWVGNVPAIPELAVSQYQTFRGFLSDEELTMMVKHVENPARCPFSRNCPERPFECLIGTLKKFPWDKTKHITVGQRYRIFQTTYKFVDILKLKVDRGIHPARLTAGLFKRLVAAAMTCPGFTVLQKADIASLVGLESDRAREFGLPLFADRWRHQYSTSVKLNVPSDLVEWYIGIIAKETKEHVDEVLSIRERQEVQRLASSTDGYWGYFWLELNLPVARTLESMTLFEIAEQEFAVMEDILRRAARKMVRGRTIQQ